MNDPQPQPRGDSHNHGRFAAPLPREPVKLRVAGPPRGAILTRADIRRERTARGLECKINFRADTAARFREARDQGGYATNSDALDAALAALAASRPD